MSYSEGGLSRFANGGAASDASDINGLLSYVTNDTAGTVEGAGYFNAAAAQLEVGDIIFAALDVDGTPATKFYVVSANDGTTVTVTAGTIAGLGASSDALTAHSGGGQGSGLALTSVLNRVTTVAVAGDSVVLTLAAPGQTQVVINSGANDLAVFPASGDAINNLGANASVTVPVNTVAVFRSTVALLWVTDVPKRDAKYTKNTTSGATSAAVGDLTGARYVQAEYSAVGAAALTVRTAAQMIADAFLQIGDSYVLEITNTSGGTTTLTTATGVTLTGTMTMATNTTRRFNVKVTGAATMTIQSTGVGTIS